MLQCEDGSILMSLCFNVIGNNGSESPVSILDNESLEFIDDDVEVVDVDVVSGKVIVNDADAPVIEDPVIADIDCPGSETGSIDITVTNGSGNYAYMWSYENRQTEDLINVPAGTYTVTVTDNDSGLSISRTYTITETSSRPPLRFTQLDAQQITCFGAADGRIEVLAIGGDDDLTHIYLCNY